MSAKVPVSILHGRRPYRHHQHAYTQPERQAAPTVPTFSLLTLPCSGKAISTPHAKQKHQRPKRERDGRRGRVSHAIHPIRASTKRYRGQVQFGPAPEPPDDT